MSAGAWLCLFTPLAGALLITHGGTRLPIQKTYVKITGVQLTLHDQPGLTAATARTLDKDPVLGPLVQAFDVFNNAVDGLVGTATVQGY